jgi:hypothetical protein
MPIEETTVEPHPTVKEQVTELSRDMEHEAKGEIHRPHDLSQSDNVVKKHISGLAISFFVLIALFLVGVIIVIALN